MYKTTRKVRKVMHHAQPALTISELLPAGRFTDASHIVSMRPYLPEEVERVRDVTRPFLEMHGEPMAWGWDAVDELGIKDISKPEFGDPVSFREGEIPVFWVGFTSDRAHARG
jgi:uncharacterized protein YcsI (UPF0317 family)